MGNFYCIHCQELLKNRFHQCGKEEKHHFEIVNGGTSWGNPLMGVGGTKDKTVQ